MVNADKVLKLCPELAVLLAMVERKTTVPNPNYKEAKLKY